MLIQVVHCHPLVESFDHALFRTILATLKQTGHQVVPTDLYCEAFQPAMSEEERRTYMGMSYDTSAVAHYAKTLKEVDGLILCFPHWWFSMPAMLKGWVDRVWGPGVAFTYDPKDNHLVPALTNVRLFGVVTTYGSPMDGGSLVRRERRPQGFDAGHEADVRQGRQLLLLGPLRHGSFD